MMILVALLLIGCGQSYEETKRISREQRREMARKDSAALKIAVMPTLDCLPLFVAQQEALLDTLHGGVRLKMYKAQMDCDTAMLRGRVEGMVTDLVRAVRINRQGLKMRYEAVTTAYWQLITNRQSRIRQLKQLDDKIVAMTRYSATDMLSDKARDSANLADNHLFKLQLNDVNVRMQMLMNNEIDALWLTEPWATMARIYKNPVLMDSRETGVQLGILAFKDKEMQRLARKEQLALLIDAWNKACDLINEKGVKHYKQLIVDKCKVKEQVVDSLPPMRYEHAQGPRQQDMEQVNLWLDANSKFMATTPSQGEKDKKPKN